MSSSRSKSHHVGCRALHTIKAHPSRRVSRAWGTWIVRKVVVPATSLGGVVPMGLDVDDDFDEVRPSSAPQKARADRGNILDRRDSFTSWHTAFSRRNSVTVPIRSLCLISSSFTPLGNDSLSTPSCRPTTAKIFSD